ncbi:MAG: xanthine dehydrogenase family protein molybdopterin-binding subunit [Chloroflexota bacterium]
MTAAATWVGKRVRRLDADDKLTGAARYASDYRPHGLLHGKVLRSDRPSARIVSIDVSAAEALPGVEAVLFGDAGCHSFGEAVKDQTVFAQGFVRHVGQAVAAVAADSPETAELACNLIRVEYEDLPAVFDPVAALGPDAPLVHPDYAAHGAPPSLRRWGNVCSQVLLETGDVDAAFAAPGSEIVESAYATHSTHQTPMETRAVVAEADARGALTIHTSTQHPFGVRQQLHEALRLPYSDIRVVAETVGGGFGSKLEATLELYAAVLARAAGRPVRIVNTRAEDLETGSPRHPMTFAIRSAVLPGGDIAAREVRVVIDAGAFTTGSPTIAAIVAQLAPGPYRIPSVRVEVLAVYTNKMAFGAYRAPGGVQAAFAVESHTDEIAARLGIGRIAIRKRNLFRDGDRGHNGQPLSGVAIEQAIDRAAAAIGLSDDPVPGSAPAPGPGGLLRGKGLACTWWLTVAGSSGCSVQLNEDGTVSVLTGATEIGTGSVAAAVAQVVAEELGVSTGKIRLIWGDTAGTPMDAGAQGSRTTYNMGRAAQRATQAARAELLRRAANLLEAAEADLEVREGRISVRGVPDRSLSYADLMAGQMWIAEPVIGQGTFLAADVPFDEATTLGSVLPTMTAPSWHCHACEVEIDPETGQTRILDYVVAQDVGYAINPVGVEGQFQGGAVQGIGFALTEELVIEDGRLRNPNLALYKLPTTLEAPRVRTEIVESPTSEGPYGAKGVGEAPVILPPAAIGSAVRAAIGVPVAATPFSPERVLSALRRGPAAAGPDAAALLAVRPASVRQG